MDLTFFLFEFHFGGKLKKQENIIHKTGRSSNSFIKKKESAVLASVDAYRHSFAHYTTRATERAYWLKMQVDYIVGLLVSY